MVPDNIFSEEEFIFAAAQRLDIDMEDIEAYSTVELVTSVAMDIYLYGVEEGDSLDQNCQRLLSRLLDGHPLSFERDSLDPTLH
jgi:hypothetical protein